MQEISFLIENYGSELSLAFMILFTIYQMYSPKFLPETKGQKFIRRILEGVYKLNSITGNDGTKGVPHRTEESDSNNVEPSHTRVTGSEDTRNGKHNGP